MISNKPLMNPSINRIAMISVHGCPEGLLGSKNAGGMNVYVGQISKELTQRNVFVDIFTRSHDSHIETINYFGDMVRIIHIACGSLSDAKNSIYDSLPEFTRNLVKFIEKESLTYDLIHSHYWFSGRVAMVLANQLNIPHITVFHTLAETKKKARVGEMEPDQRFVGEKMIIKSADSIIAFSKHEKEILINSYGAISSKIHIIPCGVDINLFKPVSSEGSKESLGLANKKVILYVGRLEPLKGVDLLLKAIAQLEDSASTQTLIVGGDVEDDEMIRLKSLSSELGISKRVNFVGRVEQSHLPLYYNAADVCVIPSYYESFGLVALEAMACGTPVVASRVGGLTSIIKNGLTGLLIPWHFPESFADGIDVILHSKSTKTVMETAAREFALSMSWSNVVDNLMQSYNALNKSQIGNTTSEK